MHHIYLLTYLLTYSFCMLTRQVILRLFDNYLCLTKAGIYVKNVDAVYKLPRKIWW